MQEGTGPCHSWDLQVSRVPDQLLRGQDHSPGLRQPTSTSIPGIHATYQCTLAWPWYLLCISMNCKSEPFCSPARSPDVPSLLEHFCRSSSNCSFSFLIWMEGKVTSEISVCLFLISFFGDTGVKPRDSGMLSKHYDSCSHIPLFLL